MMEVVEVAIGMMIVLIIFFILYKPPPQPETNPVEIKLMVLNYLYAADLHGNLSNRILANDTTSISNELKATFPTVNFTVVIDETPALPDGDVYSVTYFTPGNYTHFQPKKLIVYMWFK